MATAPASMEQPNLPLFEVRQIPHKGRGLVSRVNIATGTRILCEKPLFTARPMAVPDMEKDLAVKLKGLSKESQVQFLTLKNKSPGQYPFSGTFLSNDLPCGPDTSLAGVYPTISLINHSCIPNTHPCWNGDAEQETIHAIRPIAAGEEITIAYDGGNKTSEVRRAFLKKKYDFDCTCPGCSLPPARLQASDERRAQIADFDADIGDLTRIDTRPHDRLRDCYLLLEKVKIEYSDSVYFLSSRTYYDAFQVCVAHGDEARAGVFAEKAYQVRVICSGEDHPETQKMKSYARNPANHPMFKLCSSQWKTPRTLVPKGLDSEEYDEWLFRLKGI